MSGFYLDGTKPNFAQLMTYAEKLLVNVYSDIISRLTSRVRIALFKRLQHMEHAEKASDKEAQLWASFGAWEDEREAETIIKEIRDSRTFKEKDHTL
jgi:hypothetical protein